MTKKFRFKIKIDHDRHEVTVGGRSIHLSRKEIGILQALRNANGQVLSQEKIMELVWGYSKREIQIYKSSRKVDQHIWSLRNKFENAKSGAARAIITIATRGYKLVR